MRFEDSFRGVLKTLFGVLGLGISENSQGLEFCLLESAPEGGEGNALL
jgi:hypothetical protein